MKFFNLCLILFSFILFSCSDSSHTESLDDTTMNRYLADSLDTTPMNISNPFDSAGQIHNELLYSYYYSDNIPLTLTGIVTVTTTIANSTPSFIELTKGEPYVFTSSDRVAYIVSHLDTIRPEIINASLDTETAKVSLSNFITTFLSLCDSQEDYMPIYSFVTAYEKDIMSDLVLTVNDKKVILITTSIARHSSYVKKKKPKKNTDPDWTGLVANIFAAIDGAGEGEEEAVMRALITGIVENK